MFKLLVYRWPCGKRFHRRQMKSIRHYIWAYFCRECLSTRMSFGKFDIVNIILIICHVSILHNFIKQFFLLSGVSFICAQLQSCTLHIRWEIENVFLSYSSNENEKLLILKSKLLMSSGIFWEIEKMNDFRLRYEIFSSNSAIICFWLWEPDHFSIDQSIDVMNKVHQNGIPNTIYIILTFSTIDSFPMDNWLT